MKLLISCIFLVQTCFSQLNREPFPPLISLNNVRDCSLSKNQQEVYFTVQSPNGEASVLARMQKKDSTWQTPELLLFSGTFFDLEASLSPDNLRLYFSSNRPIDSADTKAKDFDIWFVERTDLFSDWSTPKRMESSINSEFNEFFPCVVASNSMYFTSDRFGTKGKDDIFYSKFSNGTYETPLSISTSINTTGFEFNAFVDPNEKWLIFTGYDRADGMGSGDLYISYSDENKNWLPAKSLGIRVNSSAMDYCPFVDVENKMLYFTSKRSQITSQNNFKTFNEVLLNFFQLENGQSRIYAIPIKL